MGETEVGIVPWAPGPNRETPPKLVLAYWPAWVVYAHNRVMFEGREGLISSFYKRKEV